MKKLLSTLLLLFSCFSIIYSQNKEASKFWEETKPEPVPHKVFHKTYIGTSSGINNINGLLGIHIERLTVDKLSLIGAIGLGTWGYKLSGGMRLYQHFPKQFFLGAALSYHSGVREIEFSTQSNPDTTEVHPFTFHPSINLPISLGYQGAISNDKIRFHIEVGYSIKLHCSGWESLDGDVTIDETSKDILYILQPGGIIFGAGMSFGL